MSFLEELKRRNVFRVAIGYIVTAWLLLQVVDLVLDNINSPDWVVQVFMLALAIGFPLAVLFAWAFEMTPEGLKRESDVDRSQSITSQTGKKLNTVIFVVMVLALGYFAYDKFVLSAAREAALVEATTQAVTEQASIEPAVEANIEKSIAVLPFVNMSDDKDYFADGLSEELLNLLAKIPDLKVAGRTSSFKFKGQNEDLRVIGDALDVATVLEGSVRKSGTRLRITAQLINVADGYHIWSETYDREMTDVFDMQDDIAAKIMVALKMHLGDFVVSRGRPTENMLAYEKFVMAKALWIRDEDFGPIIDLLKESVALDPSFAEAWEWLAYMYYGAAGFNLSMQEAIEATYSAATRALELDPTLVFAAALAAGADPEHVGSFLALSEFETAVQVQPDNMATHFALSYSYLLVGYSSKALPLTRRIVLIEPLSGYGLVRHGLALRAVGQLDEARAAWQRSLEQDNVEGGAHLFLDYVMAGDIPRATEILERVAKLEDIDSTDIGERVRAAADPQNGRQAVLDLLETLQMSEPESDLSWLVYFAFRQFDEVFNIVDALNAEEAAWSFAEYVVLTVNSFRESGITADPRYMEAMIDMGIVDLWEHRAPPDHCSKDSGKWVCE